MDKELAYSQNPVAQAQTEATNKLIRNTYTLLSMTLFFSAAMAGVSMALNLPHPGLIITLVGYIGLLFAVHKLQNSVWGLVAVFGFTGFLGITIGPIISAYVNFLPNGGEVVMTALGATGAIFLGLTAYVMTTKKDFSYMGGFLMAGLIVGLLLAVASIFLKMPMLNLAISGLFSLLACGLILFDTSRIVNGGETNYITATVGLYISIYMLFMNLLQILGVMSGDD